MMINSESHESIKFNLRKSKNRDIELYKHARLVNEPSFDKVHFTRHGGDNASGLRCSKACIASGSLYEMKWNELCVDTVHTGRFLACITLTDAVYQTNMCNGECMWTLVMSDDGDVEHLRLNNMSRSKSDPACAILRAHTLLHIKEPFLKKTAKGDDCFIEVDSPSDILTFPPTTLNTQDMQPDPDEFASLKKLGNSCFVAKRYEDALRYYSIALTRNMTVDVLSNRAAAHLALEHFSLAYNDASAAIKIEPGCVKAHYRAGIAAYGMRQWQRAVDSFKTSIHFDTKNNTARNELKRAEARLAEEITGHIDLTQLYSQFMNGKIRFDVADYQSAQISVEMIQDKQQGVRALVNIPRKTLLVCAKAVVWTKQSDSKEPVVFNVNTPDVKISETEHQNVLNLIYKMRFDPHLAEQIYLLYAGHKFIDNPPPSPEVIDPARIDAIMRFNATFGTNVEEVFHRGLNHRVTTEAQGVGLWLFPSFFNHSCLPNACAVWYGDIMLVYACTDIRRGDEISLAYHEASAVQFDAAGVCTPRPFASRCSALARYGFECHCELCVLENRAEYDEMDKQKLIDVATMTQYGYMNALEMALKNESMFAKYRGMASERNYIGDAEFFLHRFEEFF